MAAHDPRIYERFKSGFYVLFVFVFIGLKKTTCSAESSLFDSSTVKHDRSSSFYESTLSHNLPVVKPNDSGGSDLTHVDQGIQEFSLQQKELYKMVRLSINPPVDNTSAIPGTDIMTACHAFIDAYSEAAANYTYCAIQNARPLRFCEHCVKEYLSASVLYKSIMSENVHEDNVTLCKDLVLNSDRVQIIVKTENYIKQLWEECDCDNCFEHFKADNGTWVTHLSNDTKVFRELANKTLQCFANYSMVDLDEYTGHVPPSFRTNNSVCVACLPLYNELNELYEDMEHKNKHEVCMDVVDMMNSTRQIWSNLYSCSPGPADMWPVFILSGVFSLCPFVFYIGSRLHGAKQQQNILKQRRLRDTSAGTSSQGEDQEET